MSTGGFGAANIIAERIQTTLKAVEAEVGARSYRASNMLRNSALMILRGQGGGRSYRVPGTKRRYTASAPGSPPAVRSGAFRGSWATKVHVEKGGSSFRAIASIESSHTVNGYVLGELLEGGTSKMAARPYKDKIREHAMPGIVALYSAPYKV